jgi:thiol-disulfide isomerase/thioredoxin
MLQRYNPMTSISSSGLRNFRVGSLPFVLVILLVLSTAALRAVTEGDTYDQVITEKGKPANKLESGARMILTYPDMTIKLEAGKVVSIKGSVKENIIAASSQPQAAQIAPGQWTTDYAAALNQAKVQKRKVALLFTGSDWCPWCKRLEGEILSTPTFVAYAKSDLVLVMLDFPRQTQQPPETAAQNQKLQQQYSIDGYPTVIVLNSAGQKVGTLGYQEGGPGPFVNKLKGM